MINYGVGGNEVALDTAEKVQEIQENKTLLVAKLTSEETVSPEITEGLKTVEDVFRKFKPQVEVNHETIDGQTVTEQLRFANVGDFNPKKPDGAKRVFEQHECAARAVQQNYPSVESE